MSTSPHDLKTILVVDDDRSTLRLIGNLLQPAARVRIAPSRETALRAVASDPLPDVVLFGMDDPALAQQLVAANGKARLVHFEKPVHAWSLRRQAAVATDDEGAPLVARRALIVDDQPLMRQLITEYLDAAGIGHVEAENGEEALQQARIERFDWILMDRHMPVMDGIEATRSLRAREAQYGHARTAILGISACGDASESSQCLDAGMDEVLAKPLSPEILYAALTARLQRTA